MKRFIFIVVLDILTLHTFGVLANVACPPQGSRCQEPAQQPSASCAAPQLYSAPDDCGCLRRYCDLLQDERAVCPDGWATFVNRDRKTLCMKKFTTEVTWLRASLLCDDHHNSNLLNVRRMELFAEGNTTLLRSILQYLQHETDQRPHWSGLHVLQDKLYWDGTVPIPDRDLTAAREFGYETGSSSLVQFNQDQWLQFNGSRLCVSFRPLSHTTSGKLQPEYCISGFPFVCNIEIPANTKSYYKPTNSLLCGNEQGWVGSANSGMCYKHFTELLTFSEAQQVCQRNQGALADPRTKLNQMFLTGFLSGLENGTAPLTSHVGMELISSSQVKFGADAQLPINQLADYAILGQPTDAQKCGFFTNPFFIDERLDFGPVLFGDCATARPFICSRPFNSPTTGAARVNISVVQEGYSLTCEATGTQNLPGVFVWKKDHQYFPKQNNSRSILLGSAEYKYMIDDITDRVIDNSELAGVYACEFWQTFPNHKYKSEDVSVTFNDSTSLRLSSILDHVAWNMEFTAFNHRVSQKDELTPLVRIVYNQLLAKVRTTISPYLDTDLQFGINILFFRQTPDRKVEVDYRIRLSGEKITRTHSREVMAANDTNILENVLSTLSTSELANNRSANATIEGQFNCLQKVVIHSETLENLTLPLRASGTEIEVPGTCKGRNITMVKANCQYDQNARKSTWSSINFTSCPVDCLARDATHSVTKETFRLLNAAKGQVQTFVGSCGRREKDLFIATCTERGWDIAEQPCILTCLPEQFSHPQATSLLPEEEVPVNTTYKKNLLCDNKNKTILTAKCVLNDAGSDGRWTDISREMCEVACKSEEISHPSGKSWRLSNSSLGHSVSLSGMCDGRRTELASVTCVGNIARGATWNVSYTPCDVKCPENTFEHKDTKSPITLTPGNINQTTIYDLTCNGERMPVEAKCEGTLSAGATWKLTNVPSCNPSCASQEWYDPITDQTYVVESVEFNDEFHVKGFCGGQEMILMVAKCLGSMTDGVSWRFDAFNCTPNCDMRIVAHPDTLKNFTLPVAFYGASSTLTGACNGQSDAPLVTAECAGDITGVPEWTNINFTPCTGYCDMLPVQLNDEERRILPKKEVDEKTTVNGTCALLEFVEIEAVCIGNTAEGGNWSYTTHICDIDTRCQSEYFVHPDTKTNLKLNRTLPGVTVSLDGDCHGEEVVLLNVTCAAIAGKAGIWVNESYSTCDTETADQLTNLLENFKENPLELTTQTASLSEGLGNTTDEVIILMVDIVEFVADPNTPKSVEEEGAFFFSIIDNMMNVDLSLQETPTEKTKNITSSGNRLAKSVEEFLSSAEMNGTRRNITKSNLFVEVIDTSDLKPEDKSVINTDELSVILPNSVTNGSKLSFVQYKQSSMFPTSKTLLKDTVFSASVADTTVEGFDGAITFTMKIPSNGTLGKVPVCSYWDFQTSDWSSEGCLKVNQSDGLITCTCNHLTNFAVLMDIAGQEEYISEEHHLALSIITMVGLSISIVALCLHLISFVFIVKLRQNQFQKVLANLAFAVLATNIIFVAGVDKTANETACIAVAALLHYFILASFVWMFVEAFMQYRRFVKVLGTHVSHILLKAGLPAWIGPAVPVAIIFAVDPSLYKGGNKFCWMKPEALYYSFLLPVGCVIIANTVLFALILRGLLCARSTQLRTNKSERTMRMMYFKAGLAIFTLLGLTWVFGFLAINDARLVFQYVFCFTNAFQGLIIFIFHNIRDPKVVAWWRKVFHLKPIDSRPSGPSSTATYLSKKSAYSHSTSVTDSDAGTPRKFNQLNEKSPPPIKSVKDNPQPTDNQPSSKYLQLEQSKLMHSSTESDESNSSNATTNTTTSEF